jgi:hypothetical protein
VERRAVKLLTRCTEIGSIQRLAVLHLKGLSDLIAVFGGCGCPRTRLMLNTVGSQWWMGIVALTGAVVSILVASAREWRGYHGGGEIVPALWLLIAMSLNILAIVFGGAFLRTQRTLISWVPMIGGIAAVVAIVRIVPDQVSMWVLAVPLALALYGVGIAVRVIDKRLRSSAK